MRRIATTLLACLLVLGVALPLRAQDVQDVTVRQLNAISEENIATLEAAGTALTPDQYQELTRPAMSGQKIRFTAVVLSNPRTSGLGNPNADGFPSRIHVFVRDTSAASLGAEGMGIQLVDGSYQTTGLLNVAPGDVITVVGFADTFTGSSGASMQVSPESIELLGPYQDFGLPESIVEPVLLASTSDANKPVEGDGKVQVNWTNLPELNGQFVRIEGATVIDRDIASSPDRPNWIISTDDGETVINFYDMSLNYRNDRDGGYNADEFNVSTEDFVPPPPGATINIQGFLTFQGDDPFNRAEPVGALLSIVPFEQSDLEVTETPPEASIPSRPAAVPGPSDAVTVTTTATADASRSITSVTLHYFTSENHEAQQIAMTNVEGDSWSAEIPAQPEGAFVVYNVSVEDNTGAAFTTPSVEYRVLGEGINEIKDVQEVSTLIETSDSPFTGLTTDMNITATVQSDQAASGLLAIADDAALGPWSGVLIRRSDATAGLAKGDVINITNATVEERFGVTQLRDVTFTTVSTGGDILGYAELSTTDVVDPVIAEAHEGMLVSFDDVTITSTNPDAPAGPFGEWGFSSDGTADAQVRADDMAADIGSEYAGSLVVGTMLDYIRGVWYYSFNNYKLVPETMADIGAAINVATEQEEVPGAFALAQNYPNPFNPVTNIAFTLPASGQVTLEVYDVLGRQVAQLVNETLTAGTHEVAFDARSLPSGLYVYRLTAGSKSTARTMMLMK